MRILRTEYDLRNLINLNDVRHLREVADEAFRGLALRLRTHQPDEIRLDGGAFQDGIDALRFLGATDDQEAFLFRPLRLEVLIAHQDAYGSRDAHLQG